MRAIRARASQIEQMVIVSHECWVSLNVRVSTQVAMLNMSNVWRPSYATLPRSSDSSYVGMKVPTKMKRKIPLGRCRENLLECGAACCEAVSCESLVSGSVGGS